VPAPETFNFADLWEMVADAVEAHRENLDTDTQRAMENAGTLEGNVRDLAGTYLNADPEEIALTDSTTAGLGLVYGGLRLRAGNEIVTTEHDHYATHEAVRLAAARSGAVVRKIKLYDHPAFATVDGIVTRILGAITANTRIPEEFGLDLVAVARRVLAEHS